MPLDAHSSVKTTELIQYQLNHALRGFETRMEAMRNAQTPSFVWPIFSAILAAGALHSKLEGDFSVFLEELASRGCRVSRRLFRPLSPNYSAPFPYRRTSAKSPTALGQSYQGKGPKVRSEDNKRAFSSVQPGSDRANQHIPFKFQRSSKDTGIDLRDHYIPRFRRLGECG